MGVCFLVIRSSWHFSGWNSMQLADSHIEVSLEDAGVVYCLNCTIEEAIVSKQSDFGSFCQVFADVINVRQE